jgi:hypothetical protein
MNKLFNNYRCHIELTTTAVCTQSQQLGGYSAHVGLGFEFENWTCLFNSLGTLGKGFYIHPLFSSILISTLNQQDGHVHRWAIPCRPFSPLQTVNFRLFIRTKRTNDKLLFARWANDKRIKKNRLGFRFPFETAAYIYIYL